MIASAVVTLDASHTSPETVAQALEQLPGIETGQRFENKLPITLEADSNTEMESLTRQLSEIDGVQFVDVVYVSLENETDSTAT